MCRQKRQCVWDVIGFAFGKLGQSFEENVPARKISQHSNTPLLETQLDSLESLRFVGFCADLGRDNRYLVFPRPMLLVEPRDKCPRAARVLDPDGRKPEALVDVLDEIHALAGWPLDFVGLDGEEVVGVQRDFRKPWDGERGVVLASLDEVARRGDMNDHDAVPVAAPCVGAAGWVPEEDALALGELVEVTELLLRDLKHCVSKQRVCGGHGLAEVLLRPELVVIDEGLGLKEFLRVHVVRAKGPSPFRAGASAVLLPCGWVNTVPRAEAELGVLGVAVEPCGDILERPGCADVPDRPVLGVAQNRLQLLHGMDDLLALDGGCAILLVGRVIHEDVRGVLARLVAADGRGEEAGFAPSARPPCDIERRWGRPGGSLDGRKLGEALAERDHQPWEKFDLAVCDGPEFAQDLAGKLGRGAHVHDALVHVPPFGPQRDVHEDGGFAVVSADDGAGAVGREGVGRDVLVECAVALPPSAVRLEDTPVPQRSELDRALPELDDAVL